MPGKYSAQLDGYGPVDPNRASYPITRILTVGGIFGGGYHAPLAVLCEQAAGRPSPFTVEEMIATVILDAAVLGTVLGVGSFIIENRKVQRLETILGQFNRIVRSD